MTSGIRQASIHTTPLPSIVIGNFIPRGGGERPFDFNCIRMHQRIASEMFVNSPSSTNCWSCSTEDSSMRMSILII